MIKKILTAMLALGIVGLVAAPAVTYADCGSTKTEYINCSSKTGVGTINDLIRIVLMVVTVIIGIVAVGGLAYAAVLYASAHDNQSQVTEARKIIRNIVIGLLLYGFTVAIISWLVPGSVIG